MEPKRGDRPPHNPSSFYDHPTSFSQSYHQRNGNGYDDTFERRKKSSTMRVLVPICVLLFAAGVGIGFFASQSDDTDYVSQGYENVVIYEELVETPVISETTRNHRVSSSYGVSLLSVELIESDNFRTDDSLFIGSQGHRYNESVIFSVNARGNYVSNAFSYAIFNLDNRYTTFSTDVVARGTQPDYVEFLIEIAFDDIVEPVKTIEGFNVNMDPVPIDLDVSGVTRMYVIVRGRGSNSFNMNGIRFGNPTLQ